MASRPNLVHCFVLISCLLLNSPSLADISTSISLTGDSKEQKEPEHVSLGKAIERALRANPDVMDQRLGLRVSEILYQDAWDRMYLPSINLNLSSTSAKTVARIPGGNSATVGTALNEHGYPNTSAGISLGEYTLFDFGRQPKETTTKR